MKAQGGLGGIFAYASYTASTISFEENTPLADTITDSAKGFLDAGFVAGMRIAITDTANNNKTVTIATVTDETITILISEDLTDEAEGSATLATPSYGFQLLGFKQWSGSNGIEKVDATCFEDYPYRRHKLTVKDWSATFDGFWFSVERDSWLGRNLHLLLFQRFTLSPGSDDPAIYWSGTASVDGIPTDGGAIDTMVNETMTVKGNGALTENVKTSAWA